MSESDSDTLHVGPLLVQSDKDGGAIDVEVDGEDLQFSEVAEPIDGDEQLDSEIRRLLCESFPHVERFATQRFNTELPTRRFMLRRADGELVAHVAMHEKEFEHNGQRYTFCGVAEVMTDKRFRRRGLMRFVLARALAHYRERMDFAILMGRKEHYGWAGFKDVTNVYAFDDDPERERHNPMVLPMRKSEWFDDPKVVLNCPYF